MLAALPHLASIKFDLDSVGTIGPRQINVANDTSFWHEEDGEFLLHRAYLDVKLQNCKFCLTISEYNRRFIARHYPEIDLAKVFVARLGVDVPETEMPCT